MGNRRRPMGFFGPFNKWWSDYYLQHGRRPAKTDIAEWRAENPSWRPELTIEDIVQHSKGRRDPEKNRLYFVEYRRKMKSIAKKPARKPQRRRQQASEQGEDDDEGDHVYSDDISGAGGCTVLPGVEASPAPCDNDNKAATGGKRSLVTRGRWRTNEQVATTAPVPLSSAPGADRRCNAWQQGHDNEDGNDDDASPRSSLSDEAAAAGAARGPRPQGSSGPVSPDAGSERTASGGQLDLEATAPPDRCRVVHPILIHVRRSRGPITSQATYRNACGSIAGSPGGTGRYVGAQLGLCRPGPLDTQVNVDVYAATRVGVGAVRTADAFATCLHAQPQLGRACDEPVYTACGAWGGDDGAGASDGGGGGGYATKTATPPPVSYGNWHAEDQVVLPSPHRQAATKGADAALEPGGWWAGDGSGWPCAPTEGVQLAVWGLVDDQAASPASDPITGSGAAAREAGGATKPESHAHAAPRSDIRGFGLHSQATAPRAAAPCAALLEPSGGCHHHRSILLRACSTSGRCARRDAAVPPSLPPLRGTTARAAGRLQGPPFPCAAKPPATAHDSPAGGGGQDKGGSSGDGSGLAAPGKDDRTCCDSSSAADAWGARTVVVAAVVMPGDSAGDASPNRQRAGGAAADEPAAISQLPESQRPWHPQQHQQHDTGEDGARSQGQQQLQHLQPGSLGMGACAFGVYGRERNADFSCCLGSHQPVQPMKCPTDDLGAGSAAPPPLPYDSERNFFPVAAWVAAAGGQGSTQLGMKAVAEEGAIAGALVATVAGSAVGGTAAGYAGSQPHQQAQTQSQASLHQGAQQQQSCSGRRSRGASACWWGPADGLGLDFDSVDPTWLENLLVDPEPAEEGLWALLTEEGGLVAEG